MVQRASPSHINFPSATPAAEHSRSINHRVIGAPQADPDIRIGSAASVLQIQRRLGNQATIRMLRRQTQSSDETTIRQIETSITNLNQHTLTRDRNTHEEGGSDRTEQIEQIRALHQQIGTLQDETRKADLFMRLSQAVPFYYQLSNANVLYGSLTAAHGAAGWRSCNVTSLSMNLEGFGKTTADFSGNTQLIRNIAAVFQTALGQTSATLNPDTLRLPDYLQLVVIYVVLTTAGKIQPSNTNGMGEDIATLNTLATQNSQAFREKVMRARSTATGMITNRAVFNQFSQLFGVTSTPVYPGWDSSSPLATYKANVIREMRQEIGSGKQIIGTQPSHFVRIDSVTDNGITINNPGRWDQNERFMTWQQAKDSGLFSSGYVVMNNIRDGGVRVTTSQAHPSTESPAPLQQPGTPTPASTTATNAAAPWMNTRFYERAQHVNQKYFQHPSHAGWPYFPEWRTLWSAGKYDEFADTVARYQHNTLAEPLTRVDGILGGETYKRIARLHPEYAANAVNDADAPKIALAVGKIVFGLYKTVKHSVLLDGDSRATVAPNAGKAPAASNAGGIDRHITARIDDADMRGLIESVSAELGMNANIVRGIIATESGGNSQSGAGTQGYKGLMQSERTEDQLDPETSLRSGIAKYLNFQQQAKVMMKNFGVNSQMNEKETVSITMVLFNAGPGSVKKALQFAQQGGDAKRWFEDAYFVRSLMYYGAYSIGSMRSSFKALGGERLAQEYAAVTHKPLEDVRALAQQNGSWDLPRLINLFQEALLAEWRLTRQSPADHTLDEWSHVANGWLLQAARFKHSNLQRWYIDRILNYKTHYDLQSALRQPEIAGEVRERD